MKKIIVTLACALIAPLAFAQTSSKGTRQGTTTAESITVTGTIITTTTEEGTAASYQPIKTLVVRDCARKSKNRSACKISGWRRPNRQSTRRQRIELTNNKHKTKENYYV
jgi:hypothetical protein